MTNLLQQAFGEFERLATRTNSALRGKALLNQGWCLWLDGRFAESGIAFRQAADALSYSEDLAMARFKLADCLYRGADYTNALALYRSVTNDFSGMPRVRESLFDQVLLQIVRASIQLGDEPAAAGAMNLLLDQYPGSVAVERSMWLVSQDLLRSRQAAGARDVLVEFVKRFPGRPIVPKVELAIARSHMEQRDWPAAISAHEAWLEKYETNSLRPRAEFNRAWSYYRAGNLTNAFTYFTNFTARFPLEEQAPEAQYWVAGEFYRQKNFVDALRNFQIVVENTNWPITRLTYQARMMAGRSAFAAQLWKNAEADFTALFNDVERCPVDIAAEAVFALGDTILRSDAGPRPENGAARSVDNYVEAKRAFEKLFLPVFATNAVAVRLLPLAWGRIGDCSLQLAGQDSKQYDTATNAYWQVIQHRQSDIGIRSLAEFGIAIAHEIQAADKSSADSTALLKIALDHYYNIAVGQNLRDSEESDPQWIERAGFAAARIAETLKQWPVAVEIYQRLLRIDALASIRPRLEDKLQKARVQLGGAK
jgi:TolA-binding protein